jgi:hypothetical protein
MCKCLQSDSVTRAVLKFLRHLVVRSKFQADGVRFHVGHRFQGFHLLADLTLDHHRLESRDILSWNQEY